MISWLPCIEQETGEKPDASVIWLHGLGADGHDFVPIVPELQLPSQLAIRFIFPHAPSIPVSINQGYIMPAWYDIRPGEKGFEQDRDGIKQSANRIRALVERETLRGIKPNRIILAGFSQGGAMALFTGIGHYEPLGGIVALSAYLPCKEELAPFALGSQMKTPVFMAHGTLDEIVPFEAGEQAARWLKQLGFPVEWHSYPIGHSVCTEEVREVGQWLMRRLAPDQ